MKKNSKVTGVASLDTLVATLSRDPKFSAALAAAGFTVKKEAAEPRSRNPKVIAYHAAAAAGRVAYKAAKAKAEAAGQPYYEVSKAAGDAAIEAFYA